MAPARPPFGRSTPTALLLAGGLGLGACIVQKGAPVESVGGDASAAAGPPLRASAAATHRFIGTAIMSGRLANPKANALIAREFNSLSPENEMKWESIEPQPGAFSFGPGDKLVAFAEQNGMRMRGHTLVWHSQLAPWVKGLKGEALRSAMAKHIAAVAGHFAGHIGQWDVVNEAIADGPTGALRDDSPFTALGEGFIAEAFKLARQADPKAQLIYNDYEIEGEGVPKSEAAFQLCKRLKEAGVPIDGVGFQMHVDPRQWPTAEQIRSNVARYAALGLIVEFTEVDVPVGELVGTIDEKLQQQATIAHDIVGACMAVDKCTGITFWGLTDSDSWLNDPHWGKLRGKGPHYPLLFNASLQPKPIVGRVDAAFSGK
jgi:endo-1,4-beta-xylanase